ncbi:ArsR/SmtB family transcription factor [Brevibacillus sp. SYSU BS000544]|uniref:ArsR/SmtB family transcription factor n=1 Tax=Brevibacillus sp. SYSU BS000544 TaxID=3416443 RepID=UPI003CE5980B
MKKYFVIETLEQMKAVSDPLRIQLITMLLVEELTGKQLAERIGQSPSRIHYHLKELETNGFIEVKRTEEKNGIIQKFYRSTALDFVISEELLPHLREDTTFAQEIIVNQLRSAISRVYKSPDSSFQKFAELEDKPPFVAVVGEAKLPREVINEWLTRYEALLQELWEKEREYQAQIDAGEARDLNEIFYLLNVGFMTNEQHFLPDDDRLPEGYEMLSPIVVKRKDDPE